MAVQQEQYGQIANYNISPGTRGNGQSSALEVDSVGNLLVNINSGIPSGLPITLVARSSDYYPMYSNMSLGGLTLATDPSGALVVRGAVTTDEGSSRVSFTGSTLFYTPSGTATFTNGSFTVTGSGFLAAGMHFQDYIKLNADSESAWAQVGFVDSDTSISLLTAYTGTGGTGSYNVSNFATVTGTSATISVGSGQLTIAAGTNSATQSAIFVGGGAGSIFVQSSFSISQRVANQDMYFGIETALTSPITQFSRFHFNGTDNTKVITETGYNPTTDPSSAEKQTTTVTLASAGTTGSAHVYKIEQEYDQIIFTIDNSVVATHAIRIPHIASEGSNSNFVNIRTVSSGSVTNTNIVVDFISHRNFDRLDNFQQAIALTDYTNTANVLNGITGLSAGGENAQLVAPAYREITGLSAAGVGQFLVPSTDVSNYREISLHVTANAGALISEASNDNTNWLTMFMYAVPTGLASSTPSTVGMYKIPVNFRYFRVRMTSYTSGASTGVMELYGASAVSSNILVQQNGTWTVGASSAIGSAVPVTAFLMGMVDTSGNLIGVRSAANLGDTAGGSGVLATGNMFFNGTAYDRNRNNFNTTTGDTPTITTATTTTGATQTNYNARGAIITAILGTVTGASPSLALQLQWSPDAGTTWLTYGAAGVALAVATGNTVGLICYPTALPVNLLGTTTTGDNPQINAPLPRTWRVTYISSGTITSIAVASVQVNYML